MKHKAVAVSDGVRRALYAVQIILECILVALAAPDYVPEYLWLGRLWVFLALVFPVWWIVRAVICLGSSSGGLSVRLAAGLVIIISAGLVVALVISRREILPSRLHAVHRFPEAGFTLYLYAVGGQEEYTEVKLQHQPLPWMTSLLLFESSVGGITVDFNRKETVISDGVQTVRLLPDSRVGMMP